MERDIEIEMEMGTLGVTEFSVHISESAASVNSETKVSLHVWFVSRFI